MTERRIVPARPGWPCQYGPCQTEAAFLSITRRTRMSGSTMEWRKHLCRRHGAAAARRFRLSLPEVSDVR